MQRSNRLITTVVLGGFRRNAKRATTPALLTPNYISPVINAVQNKSTYVNNHSFHSHAKNNKLRIKKVLIVTKLTRYEFEKLRQPNLDDGQLEEAIKYRGTDYDALMYYHNLHKTVERKVVDSFSQMGVEVKVVNRITITKELLKWTDLIVPVGGDGTFLLAASRATPFFVDNSVPIVGFNSDPLRSEGRLMLHKQYTTDVNDAVKKIIKGEFDWMHRSRIRITLLKFNGDTPIPVDLHEFNPAPVEHKELIVSEPTLLDQINGGAYHPGKKTKATKRMLPYLALNEVFIGETLSARVSHLHIRPSTTQKITKTKSSGLCVSTGTGSTSWHTSINRLSTKNVEDLLKILKNGSKLDLNGLNAEAISDIYNQQLVFEPDDPRLCYSIREQICVGVWPNPKGFESRDFSQNLYVKSRCFDASLVIDGTICYPFNDGTKAFLEVLPEDALLTMKIVD